MYRKSRCENGIVYVPPCQFLVIGRLTLGFLHNSAFRSIESHWFLGPASANKVKKDVDAIKEVKDDVVTAKEVKDGGKVDTPKVEINATHGRWRPFGSGLFARVAKTGVDADKK